MSAAAYNPLRCELCGGEGWIRSTKRIKIHTRFEILEYDTDGAERCVCGSEAIFIFFQEMLAAKLADAKAAYTRRVAEISEEHHRIARADPADLNYPDFLASPYWHWLRDHMKERAGFVCQDCGQKFPPPQNGLEVHHLTYEHRGREWAYLSDLVVLCAECHEKRHFPLAGAK